MSNEVITDLYCEGITDPIPFAGTPAAFESMREDARVRSGSGGMRSLVLRWRVEGRPVVLDLNRTKVIAMVQR